MKTRNVLVRACGVVLGLLAFVSACASDQQAVPVTKDNPAVAGLPVDVVAERLADPVFQVTMREWDKDTLKQMVQLNISSVVYCRDTLGVYRKWVNAGATPEIPRIARPDKPEPGFDEFMNSYQRQVTEATATGDPESLRNWLLADGAGCRQNIADPRDPKKTIGDVLG